VALARARVGPGPYLALSQKEGMRPAAQSVFGSEPTAELPRVDKGPEALLPRTLPVL